MDLNLTGRPRCSWAQGSELMVRYHDEEWGIPLHDDNRLFEYLILETMQAGLSWAAILQRREEFRRAFFDFDLDRLSSSSSEQVETWMLDPGIIRNRAKLKAVLSNAAAFQKVQLIFGSFDSYQWEFVGGKPLIGARKTVADLPSSTDLSIAFSKDLKSRGFSFIGPTTCYAHMQATGMVNDHVLDCWRNST